MYFGIEFRSRLQSRICSKPYSFLRCLFYRKSHDSIITENQFCCIEYKEEGSKNKNKKYYLITGGTPGLHTLSMMPSTVQPPILPEVDQVHQEFLTGGADEAGWMPPGCWSSASGCNAHIASWHRLLTLWKKINRLVKGTGVDIVELRRYDSVGCLSCHWFVCLRHMR